MERAHSHNSSISTLTSPFSAWNCWYKMGLYLQQISRPLWYHPEHLWNTESIVLFLRCSLVLTLSLTHLRPRFLHISKLLSQRFECLFIMIHKMTLHWDSRFFDATHPSCLISNPKWTDIPSIYSYDVFRQSTCPIAVNQLAPSPFLLHNFPAKTIFPFHLLLIDHPRATLPI